MTRVVWTRRRPGPDVLARFVATEGTRPFTYDAVGASRRETTDGPGRAEVPAGFTLAHNREPLGRGRDTFERAVDQLRAWRMLPPWTSVAPPDAPIEAGRALVVLVHAFGVWFQNAARIVYVIDEPRCFGFAYGTLPAHAECGEERFVVEWLDDDTVWYDVRAFSKPRYWGARLAYPLTRALQRRFGRDSKAAMRHAVR